MPRFALLLLMAVYALMPPGFCLCRVSAMVLPATEATCPNHHDDDDDDDCPHIQQEGISPTSLCVIAGVLPPQTCVAAGDTTRPRFSTEDLSLSGRDLDQPLYQILRAYLL